MGSSKAVFNSFRIDSEGRNNRMSLNSKINSNKKHPNYWHLSKFYNK